MIEENHDTISDNVEEIKQDVVKEIEKELKKALNRLRQHNGRFVDFIKSRGALIVATALLLIVIISLIKSAKA